MPPRRATVLGASGYVGSHLLAHLRRQGWQCTAPARNADLCASGPVGALGTVFYCIGLTADFRQRPLDTVHAHVEVLRALLQHASFERLVYLSSTRVYLGASATHEDAALSARPGDADDLYKLSKLLGESLALHGGKPGAVVRLSNVVGGSMSNPESFLAQLWREARAGHVHLRSHPDSEKDYIHINDVCALLEAVASHGRAPVYNLASGVQVSHRQWLQALAQATGCGWDVAPHAPLHRLMPIDVTRITQEFAFQPQPVLPVLEAGPPISQEMPA